MRNISLSNEKPRRVSRLSRVARSFPLTACCCSTRIIGQLKTRLDEIGAKGLIVHASKEVSEHDYLVDSPLPVLDLYPEMSAYEQEHSVQLYYTDGVH